MMKQYLEIRKSLPPKVLLFFRLGDFYEMFNEDAKIGARLLSITLTRRGDMPMAGVPYHAAASYINKLLSFGYKIAICDQTSVPKPGQLVERSISRILTPGTAIEDQQIDNSKNQYILSIKPTVRELSIAWLEASTGEFQVATNRDHSQLLSIAFAINPSEIIVPENIRGSLESLPTNVRESLSSLMTKIVVSELPDFYFDFTHGLNLVKDYLHVLNLDGFGIHEQDYQALGPAGAILHYIEENFRQRQQNIQSIKLYKPQEFMQIDHSTMRNLEIFYSTSGQKVGSLSHSINFTITPAGSRQLERFLIEPSIKKNEILFRQNCVRAFFEDEFLLESVQKCLKETCDIARILTRLQNRMRNPRELGAIRSTIKQFPKLKDLLNDSHVPELMKFSSKISSFYELEILLNKALGESLPTDLVTGGYIKDGYDANLDELRSLSKNCKSWICSFEALEQSKTGIKSLKVKYNNTFGYFIEVTKSNLHLVPSNYIRRQTTVNGERYVTDELRQKEHEILNAQTLAIDLEEKIFDNLLSETLKKSRELSLAAVILAKLDVFTGWAILAKKHRYCCPEISDEDCLKIEDGRHPVIEQITDSNCEASSDVIHKFVPNDTFLKNDDTQILLITGPNMAGKSTYIRQVALITLLAHIGCWVPAKKCRLSLVDKIFSRIGSGDDLSRGRSTFMMEMCETANILNNATDASLIILDEVGRGTSTYDGLSIAWSVIEFLHKDSKSGPKTLFATHYHELTKLSQSLPRLKNFQMEVKEINGEIFFMRKVIAGASDKSYGIHVAKLAGMPRSVTARAEVILQELENDSNIFAKNIWRKRYSEDNGENLQISLF